MAGVSDGITDHLLFQIALASGQGLDAASFVRHVADYHKNDLDSPENDAGESSDQDLFLSAAPPQTAVVLDTQYLESLWTWIQNHEEISVIHADPVLQDDSLGTGDTDHSAFVKDHSSERLVTTELRIWHALTDHGIDYKRVPKSEFICLCVIAAHGPSGLLQPDLVRITGQDKRSVPKRTDMLAAKGYISKDLCIGSGMKTSLLRLKKFSGPEGPNVERTQVESGSARIKDAHDKTTIIMVDHWYDVIIQVLQSGPDKTARLEDLREATGVAGHPLPTRTLRQCLKRLRHAGLISKVRVKDLPADANAVQRASKKQLSGNRYTHVSLLREPQEGDRAIFVASLKKDSEYMKLNTSINTDGMSESAGIADEDDDDEVDNDENLDEYFDDEVAPRSYTDDLAATTSIASGPSPLTRLQALWTPEVHYSTMFFEVVNALGQRGASSLELCRATGGPMWRRPFDEMMGRLTNMWHVSQPPDIRRLTILRDTSIPQTVSQYHFRTWDNFELATQAEEASWEYMLTEKDVVKAVNQLPNLDSWGFPSVRPRELAGSRKSVRQCARAIPAVDTNRYESGFRKRGRPRKHPKAMALKASNAAALLHPASKATTTVGMPEVTASLADNAGLENLHPEPRKAVQPPGFATPLTDRAQLSGRKRRRPNEADRSEQVESEAIVTADAPPSLVQPAVPYGEIDSSNADPIPVVKRPRGRPPKVREVAHGAGGNIAQVDVSNGRPKPTLSQDTFAPQSQSQTGIQPPKKRGRPPKHPQQSDSQVPSSTNKKLKDPRKRNISSHKSLAWLQRYHDLEQAWNSRYDNLARRLAFEASRASTALEPESDSLPDGRTSVATQDTTTNNIVPEHTRKRTKVSDDPDNTTATPSGVDATLQGTEYSANLVGLAATSWMSVNAPQRESTTLKRKPGREDGPTRTTADVAQLEHDLKNMLRPGVYIDNPVVSMARRDAGSGKGRPRKALIATFKSEKLGDLRWFVAEPTCGTAQGPQHHRAALGAEETLNDVTTDHDVNKSSAGRSNLHKEDHETTPVDIREVAASSDSATLTNHETDFVAIGGRSSYDDASCVANSALVDRMDESNGEPAASESAQSRPNAREGGSERISSLSGNIEAQSVDIGEPAPDDAQGDASYLPTAVEVDDRTNAINEDPLRFQVSDSLSTKAALSEENHRTRGFDSQPSASNMTTSDPLIAIRTIERQEAEPSKYLDSADTLAIALVESDKRLPSSDIRAEPITIESQLIPEGDGDTRSPDELIHPSRKSVIDIDKSGMDLWNAVQRSPSKQTNASTARQQTYKPRRGINRSGGVVEFQRTKMLLDIIRQCGGVFPGRIELFHPFAVAWQAKHFQVPDRQTLHRSLNNLLASGRLKQINITFHDEQSRMISKDILAAPYVHQYDTVVEELRDNMKKLHPTPYIPSHLPIPERAKKAIQRSQTKVNAAKRNANSVRYSMDSDHGSINHDRRQPLRLGMIDEELRAGTERRRRLRDAESVDGTNAAFHAQSDVRRGPAVPRDMGDLDDEVLERVTQFQVTGYDHQQSFYDRGPRGRAHLAKRLRFQSRLQQPVKRGRPIGSLKSHRERIEAQRRAAKPKEKLDSVPAMNDQTHELRQEQANEPGELIFVYSGVRDFDAAFADSERIDRQDQKGTSEDAGLAARTSNVTSTSHSFAHFEVDISDIVHEASVNRDKSFEGTYANVEDIRFERAVHDIELWEKTIAGKSRGAAFAGAQMGFINLTVARSWQGVKIVPRQHNGRPSRKIEGEDGPTFQLDPTVSLANVLGLSTVTQRPSSANDTFNFNLDPLLGGTTSPAVTKTPRRSYAHAAVLPGHQSRARADTTNQTTTRRNDPRDRDIPDNARDVPSYFQTGNGTVIHRADEDVSMTAADERRLIYALTVVRTLLGGLQQGARTINYACVNQAMHFKFDGRYVREHWNKMRPKHEPFLEQLQQQFRRSFLRAYERGEVPELDTAVPETMDWAYLTDWAMSKLNKHATSAKLLPSSRETFDNEYVVHMSGETYATDTSDLFVANTSGTRRDGIVYNVGFHDPMPYGKQMLGCSGQGVKCMLAQSWIRANVMTTEEAYDGHMAQAKLLQLGEPTVKEATNVLLGTKIIKGAFKGRNQPGRNFIISDQLRNIFPLPWQWDTALFIEAAHFKSQLDSRFKSPNGGFDFSEEYHADYRLSNAQAMVLDNMVNHERISVRVELPEVDDDFDRPFPKLTKWGFLEGSYKTSQMDTAKLRFGVSITPRPSYRIEKDAIKLVSIPREVRMSEDEEDEEMAVAGQGRLPFWTDIHGNLLGDNLRDLLLTTLYLLLGRGTATTALMARLLQNRFWIWELDALMSWAEAVGLVRNVNKLDDGAETAWELDEWWWLAARALKDVGVQL